MEEFVCLFNYFETAAGFLCMADEVQKGWNSPRG